MNTRTAWMTIGFLLLTACGGGGDETEFVAGIDGRGVAIESPIVAVGAITGFGSIVVNGVRYETDSATFDIDGSAGTQADLAVGHIVIVTGTIADDGSDPVASNVFFDDIVEGPVTAIDVVANTIVVLGQIVQISGGTSFDDNISPASITGLSLNDIVEVSGFRRSDQTVGATRIEAKPASTEYEVTGTVEELAGMTFRIGGLIVDFSSAQMDDFPSGGISNGQVVEAKGTAIDTDGRFVASRVELKGSEFDAGDGDEAEIEGFITRFVSADDFDVGAVSVTTTSSTVYEGGTATDLGLNVKVEVEGRFNSAGVLVADDVDIRQSNQVRVTALVDSVDAAAGTLVLLGISVEVDELTRIEDKSDADVRPFTLADLNAGDYVHLRGDVNPPGGSQVTATLLEREDPDTETILRGFVDSVTNPNYTVLGVTVETGSRTVFRDAAENVISSGEFFGSLESGDLVEAQGNESSTTTIVAEEVELENEF